MKTFRVMLGMLAMLVSASANAAESRGPRPIESPLPAYPSNVTIGPEGTNVCLIVFVDEQGRVEWTLPTENSDARLIDTCKEAVGRWKFEPARYYREAVGGTFVASIDFKGGVVSIHPEVEIETPREPPKPLIQVRPEFPPQLLRSRNSGKVVLGFIVDSNGDVRNPAIVMSTDPLFEAAAVKALLQWKFKPGLVDGRAVNTRAVVPIVFKLDGVDYAESYVMKGKPDGDQPEAVRFDKAPKPKQTVRPVFPYEDAIKGETGFAEVKFVVGADGSVVGTRVVKASKPEFGMALAAAMEAWTFEPASRKGKPVMALIGRRQSFKPGGRDSAVDRDVARIAGQIRDGKFSPAKVGDLDVPLKPRFRVAPVYPSALEKQAEDGDAVIEFIVDKKGRAVLPKILKASAPEFGWAAATAAQRWIFDPPTVNGKRVEVVAAIPFKFTGPPKADPPAAN